MQGNRSRDTAPELAVRRLLHSAGLRYRVQIAPLPGLRRTADVVFSRERIAIFIDGCYWHGCPAHYAPPASHADFWREKVERNRTRDLDTTAKLTANGWTVLRYWTHEPPDEVAASIRAAVSDARAAARPAASPSPAQSGPPSARILS